MTTGEGPQTGFWQLVTRPFRAVGRGITRAGEFIDFVSLIVNIGRGIALVVRGLGRLFSDWF
ncbi:hypothetical protein [Cellulomonas sp. URHB0016]